MKNKLFTSMLLLTLVIVFNDAVLAQQQVPKTKHLSSEDSAAVNALVLYPDTIRLDIFEACEYPASIVSVATLQKNTSSDFANLISSYSKEEQDDYWNLSRYPDLVSKLAQGGEKSKEQIEAILADYPKDIHEVALKYGKKHYDVLQKMDQMQSSTNTQFEQILSDYPPETQKAIRDLTKYPEIINLLNDHLSLAVRVGDHYRRDPQRVIHRADSMNLAEVRQNAQDAEAWKQEMQQNPDEAKDLKNASKEYAKDNGYNDDDINTPPDSEYISNYTCTPYDYWFGYPGWYPYAYWYPYPFWFDCGFYFGPYGNMIFFGTPSFYFTSWYFYYPEHWHRYPYLGNRYIDHYYGPRGFAGANREIVHNWVHENRSYLPKDFATNRTNRVEAIKQVGQMHIDAQKQSGDKAMTSAARDQYFNNNASKYPALSTSKISEAEMQERQQNTRAMEQPAKQPAAKISKTDQQAPANQQRKAPVSNFNNMNKAQQYHRSVWDRIQPAMRQIAPSRSSFPSGGGRSFAPSGGGGRRR